MIRDGDPAARAERQILALALVLQQEERHVEGLEPRSGRRQPGGETRDGAGRREVALELRGGDREHVGVVVEAGVRRLVARQQQRHVEIQGQQVANRVPVLGPVQPVDRAGPAGVRVRRRYPVDVRFEPGRHGVVGRRIRARAARRRHRPGSQLRDHPLPDVRVAARVRGVDRGRVQREPAGPEPVVVTGDAVPVEDGARRGKRGRLGGSGSLYGRRNGSGSRRGPCRHRRMLGPGAGQGRLGRHLGQEGGGGEREPDGAGRHEHGGSRQPGRPAPTVALPSRHRSFSSDSRPARSRGSYPAPD